MHGGGISSAVCRLSSIVFFFLEVPPANINLVTRCHPPKLQLKEATDSTRSLIMHVIVAMLNVECDNAVDR